MGDDGDDFGEYTLESAEILRSYVCAYTRHVLTGGEKKISSRFPWTFFLS